MSRKPKLSDTFSAALKEAVDSGERIELWKIHFKAVMRLRGSRLKYLRLKNEGPAAGDEKAHDEKIKELNYVMWHQRNELDAVCQAMAMNTGKTGDDYAVAYEGIKKQSETTINATQLVTDGMRPEEAMVYVLKKFLGREAETLGKLSNEREKATNSTAGG